MNKTCLPVSRDNYEKIIKTIREGYQFNGKRIKPNERVALILVAESVTGIRVGDILKLRLDSVVKRENGYYFNIIEEKTKKRRNFPFNTELYLLLQTYALEHGISRDELLFPIKERQVFRVLEMAVKYLGLENESIGSHSFRKMFAQNIYEETGNNLAIVQQVLQHSSLLVTQRYLNVASQEVIAALNTTSKFVI